jgi:hypothetical protein
LQDLGRFAKGGKILWDELIYGLESIPIGFNALSRVGLRERPLGLLGHVKEDKKEPAGPVLRMRLGFEDSAQTQNRNSKAFFIFSNFFESNSNLNVK